MSYLEVILTALLVLTALYVAFKQWIQGPRIDVHIGDTVDLVRSTNGKVEKLHLTCSFQNTSNRTGLVSKIAVVVIDGKFKHFFNWLQFYEYTGGHIATPKSKPYPIPVLGRSATFEGIEFITNAPLHIHTAVYRFVVLAWSGGDIIPSKPFLTKRFEFTLDKGDVKELSPKKRPGEFFLHSVSLSGMQVTLDDLRGLLENQSEG